jgi:hypothetical protein
MFDISINTRFTMFPRIHGFAGIVALVVLSLASLTGCERPEFLKKKDADFQPAIAPEKEQRSLPGAFDQLRSQVIPRGTSIPSPLSTPSTAQTGSPQATAGGRTYEEIYLSLAVLLFGFLTMAPQVTVMVFRHKGWGPESIKVVGLSLVIVAALFLVTAGYSANQIAPVIGLLGTIAGYLLGQQSKKADDN